MNTQTVTNLYAQFHALTGDAVAASNLVLAQASFAKPLPDALLTADEVAAMFNVDARTIRRRVADGTFPAPVKVGRSVRWRRSDLERLW